jgi:hypothetical protein
MTSKLSPAEVYTLQHKELMVHSPISTDYTDQHAHGSTTCLTALNSNSASRNHGPSTYSVNKKLLALAACMPPRCMLLPPGLPRCSFSFDSCSAFATAMVAAVVSGATDA